MSLKKIATITALGTLVVGGIIYGSSTDETRVMVGTYRGYSDTKNSFGGRRSMKIDNEWYESNVRPDTLDLNREYLFTIEKPELAWIWDNRVVKAEELKRK
jgi:hypothetical protein